MKPRQISTKTPPAATGLFALLGALLCIAGGGASAALPATAGASAAIEGPPIFSSAPGLPDGRVYEEVSPAYKDGNEAGAGTNPFLVGANNKWGVAAAGGDSVLFEGTGPMGEKSPWGASQYFVATKRRNEVGWSTRALLPRAQQSLETLAAKPQLIDPAADFEHAMFESGPGSYGSDMPSECDGAPVSYQIYLAGPEPLLPATWLERPAAGVEDCNGSGTPVGGTPDFSTVYFTFSGTLLQAEDAKRAPHAALGEAAGFYEDREGSLREADVLPADSPYPGEPSPFGAVPAGGGREVLYGNEVSSETYPGGPPAGSRAFFVSPDPASCEPAGENDCTADPPELYVRENGETTLLVSRDALLPAVGGLPASAPAGVSYMSNPSPHTARNGSAQSGSYVFASPDGSQAFFQSAGDLTEAARQAGSGSEPKTYDFDLETGALTYIPGVVGPIVAIDTRGSAFAFVKPKAGAEAAQLDLWSAGPEGAGDGGVTAVTELPEAEGPYGELAGVSQERMSNDGSVLVFETGARLSSVFNSGAQQQVYRYDAATNTLGCVSCAPAGVTPSGPASISSLQPSETYEFNAGDIPGMVDSRGISANGDRIFFDTPDPLVPQDSNTNAPPVEVREDEFEKQGRDVYEWENGVVYLISGGKSPRDSYFLDSGENGEDVFFATTEALVPGDTDGGYDVYDARIPHPGDNPPATAVGCEGSVCQGPPNVPTPLTPPAGATFAGLGNPVPEPVIATPTAVAKKSAKCRKGYAKKKNKCTKQKAEKKAKKTSNERRTES